MTAVSHPSPLPVVVRTAPGVSAGGLKVAAAIAVATLAWLGANVSARAQFLSNYPVLVVPPPPAQNLILPKSNPRTTPKSTPAPQTPPQPVENYHGQTREPVGRF